MDSTFIQDRIDATKALIVAYEDAVSSLVSGEISEYTLDTGQSRQTVKKHDIDKLNLAIDGLYNRCATLESRLNGGGVVHMRPAW